MLTYRIRRRHLRFSDGYQIGSPTIASITFTLQPGQAFGTDAGGGRTVVRATPAKGTFDAFTGQYFLASDSPLEPLNLDFGDGIASVRVRGADLTVDVPVESMEQLAEFIEAIYYSLPVLLALDVADPPTITSLNGTVDGHEFQWILDFSGGSIHPTTQELQGERIRVAWNRLRALAEPANRRIAAALHYFHIATRLERVAGSPGEFLAEALPNYAKILEVLFGPSTDAMRDRLRKLGIAADAIERDFVPAVILRSKIDVAHVSLALFDASELQVLQRVADRAEEQFRHLLALMVRRLDGDNLDLPDYDIHGADSDIKNIITRLSAALDALGNRP